MAQISIIVSAYNESEILLDFYDCLLQKIRTFDYEIIFVNDGSTDDTKEIILQIINNNQRVKLISLSRNFGHEAAMIAGIDYAKGDFLICMDADLQHPPHMISEMLKKAQEQLLDVVLMKRICKRQWVSTLFYRVLNLLSTEQIVSNASDFFLISKRVANVLRSNYRERVRFLRGIIQILGFNKSILCYETKERLAGRSKYSMRKLFSLSMVAISSLSTRPLKISIWIGVVASLFSLILGVYSVIMWFVDKPVSGYTTLIVFLCFMFGLQFILLGIIGQYVGFLFDESKQRPIYLVDDIITYGKITQ